MTTRGLVVICREPETPPGLLRLAERYLVFVLYAHASWRPVPMWSLRPQAGRRDTPMAQGYLTGRRCPADGHQSP
jgi:hypothetical protein